MKKLTFGPTAAHKSGYTGYFRRTQDNIVTCDCQKCGDPMSGYPEDFHEWVGENPSGLVCRVLCQKCGAFDAVTVPIPDDDLSSRRLNRGFFGKRGRLSDG